MRRTRREKKERNERRRLASYLRVLCWWWKRYRPGLLVEWCNRPSCSRTETANRKRKNQIIVRYSARKSPQSFASRKRNSVSVEDTAGWGKKRCGRKVAEKRRNKRRSRTRRSERWGEFRQQGNELGHRRDGRKGTGGYRIKRPFWGGLATAAFHQRSRPRSYLSQICTTLAIFSP